jgi:hypothetical protein
VSACKVCDVEVPPSRVLCAGCTPDWLDSPERKTAMDEVRQSGGWGGRADKGLQDFITRARAERQPEVKP